MGHGARDADRATVTPLGVHQRLAMYESRGLLRKSGASSRAGGATCGIPAMDPPLDVVQPGERDVVLLGTLGVAVYLL